MNRENTTRGFMYPRVAVKNGRQVGYGVVVSPLQLHPHPPPQHDCGTSQQSPNTFL